MHPADARTRQIGQGDTVRLWNARGQCIATAHLTETLRQGVLVLPVGAWLTRDPESGLDLSGNPNVLTLDIPTSAFGQGPSAQTCMVNVEVVAANTRDSTEVYQQEIDALVRQGSG
jgi:biotin/methionine sulfoxide reductase